MNILKYKILSWNFEFSNKVSTIVYVLPSKNVLVYLRGKFSTNSQKKKTECVGKKLYV